MSEEAKKYGYFSEAALRGHGSVYWKTLSGAEVLVTGTGHHESPRDGGYLWGDAVCVGEITAYSRGSTSCVARSTWPQVDQETSETGVRIGNNWFYFPAAMERERLHRAFLAVFVGSGEHYFGSTGIDAREARTITEDYWQEVIEKLNELEK